MFNHRIPSHRAYSGESSSNPARPVPGSSPQSSGIIPEHSFSSSQQQPLAETDFVLLSDLFRTPQQPAHPDHLATYRLNERSPSFHATAPSVSASASIPNLEENTPGFFSHFLQLCSTPSPVPASKATESHPQNTANPMNAHPVDAIPQPQAEQNPETEESPEADQNTDEFLNAFMRDMMPDAPWQSDNEDEMPAPAFYSSVNPFAHDKGKSKDKGKAVAEPEQNSHPFPFPSSAGVVIREPGHDNSMDVRLEGHASNPSEHGAAEHNSAAQNSEPTFYLSFVNPPVLNPFQSVVNPNKRKRDADHLNQETYRPVKNPPKSYAFYTPQDKQQFVNFYKEHSHRPYLKILDLFSKKYFPVTRTISKKWVEEAGVAPFSPEHQKFRDALTAFVQQHRMNSSEPLTRNSASVQAFVQNYQKESGRSQSLLSRWLGTFFKLNRPGIDKP